MKNLIIKLTINAKKYIKKQLIAKKSHIACTLFGMIVAIVLVVYVQRDAFISFAETKYKNIISNAVETLQPTEMSVTKNDAAAIILKRQEDQRIGEYVMFIMSVSNTKMSDFQKQLLAQTIVRVSGSVFDTETERQWAIVLVNNESGFDRSARSSAGAVGLTQVMPQFISEFGGHCGIEVGLHEVMDTETNLLLGFCRFKHLLNAYKGVVTTALAAYNAGKRAKSVKELQRLANLTNEETLQYIARFAHITAMADANFKFTKTTTEATPALTENTK